MSVSSHSDKALSCGGIPLDLALSALKRLEPQARACYVYDLDAIGARARRFANAFADLGALCAYAVKANGLPAILEQVRASGLGADAGSLGELELAAATGFEPAQRVLNGNGRTPEEAEWVARNGVHSVNADHVLELDLLERAAARAGRTIRVALRVNPGLATPGHRYVATGDDAAKFGIDPDEAVEAWVARARWPHLELDGIHVHVGSQLLEPTPIARAVESALALVDESERRGAPLGLVNLGGGYGVDYERDAKEFPLEAHASELIARAGSRKLEWVLEPGRWITAAAGLLVAEVLWVKLRKGRRFVVLAAGMNDLLRPALYHARHRIVPVRPRGGAETPATVVGPVCESADVFTEDAWLPALEAGDLVAILDVGAYGASMASNYNGRGRLAELVIQDGRLMRARAGEGAEDLLARRRADPLQP